MDKPTLIGMVGLPRSGKSTWAKEAGHPTVCLDSIRLALHGQAYIQSAEPFVRAIARVMVESLFLSGHKTVILDATNVTRKIRSEWKSDKWANVWMHIRTDYDVCVKRAEGNKKLQEVIHDMYSKFESFEAGETYSIIQPPIRENHVVCS